MPSRLDITRRLQERLLEIVRSALPLIAGSIGDADLNGLAHLREEMVHTIDLYCRHVDDLRVEAERLDDRRLLADAARLAEGCAALRAAYQAFRARWAAREAPDNWHEYRLSAVVMMKQMRGHVQMAQAGDQKALLPA